MTFALIYSPSTSSSIPAHTPLPPSPLMRRKKRLDRGGGGDGGGGTELFICFTSRPSAASSASVAGGGSPSSLRPSSSSKLLSPGRVGGAGSAGAGADAPAPPIHPSLSRRLRNSSSLKGGQSPMFPSGSTSGRRGRGGFEPAEPSSPKVTCIGQVRVKGGKRKPKHASAGSLLSRSRRGGVGGSAEASFRRAGDDRDGPQGKNQGWVYQIPVNICEALKTFGSCGGHSLCSPSRSGGGERCALSGSAGHTDKKRRQRAPAGGSWLCGAAVARCLLAIQEEEDDEFGKGAAVVPADEMRASEVGLVMEGWDVEEERGVMVGEIEVEKKDEILVVGKEEEGRVSVCIPPRNALLLMRCRSDPVRMAALATRFWGSPQAATDGQVDNEVVGDDDEEDEEEGDDEAETQVEKECKDEARDSAVSVEDVKCRERGDGEDDGGDEGKIDQVHAEADESSKCGDLVEEKKDGHCRKEGEEAQIVWKDVMLEVTLGEDEERENKGLGMVELVADGKEEDVPAPEKGEDELKGRRSISSYSPSTALKEDRKLRQLSSRRRVSTSSRTSSVSDRVGMRRSFSAETVEGRRSSFSSLKDSRRASFSIDRDGRRWSFSIEQEHFIAEPKVLMASRNGKKTSSEPESENDYAVVVAPNSAEEDKESQDDRKEEVTKNGEEEGTTQDEDMNQKVDKVETRGEEGEAGQVQRRKKSGELPDCLLLMMYEPKLSMEVSKETWVCSTDFVHWKSYQGKNNHNRHQHKASGSGNDAAMEEPKDKENAEGTTIANDAEHSKYQSVVNSVPMLPPVVQKTPPPKVTTEQKLKLELPLVANTAAYAPFVLKRCQSEPMRSSARLAPDACFWKDRHRPLNATGIGF
ncbi:uncharacterized protein LOC133883754 [Phragmites australis]|uniref:uncharacterized protein LOC133883754 n=1 Tax=Phragmites australis TaxID=29695 RepID=UPI002D779E29|nr:uncharacterized protein LOC133883754 [Phragmites australis]